MRSDNEIGYPDMTSIRPDALDAHQAVAEYNVEHILTIILGRLFS
jgi:hypothetical protein